MASSQAHIKSSISLPHRRLREIASCLLEYHPLHVGSSTLTQEKQGIRIVCISDTHNTYPDLPPGDVLIHAGDLTENGSFGEFQEALTWLAAQPHAHKLLIAGNHDVILDEKFLERHPERRHHDSRTRKDLRWGSVTYLQDDTKSIKIGTRSLSVYGSPWTPQYGVSAFQYRRGDDFWNLKIPKADIVITHGPPLLHLDQRDFYRGGCPSLTDEITRVRPRLVVFGHIHAAHGRDNVVMDATRRIYENVISGWGGWLDVILMAFWVVLARVAVIVMGRQWIHRQRVTTFVNASMVGREKNEVQHEAIVVEL